MLERAEQRVKAAGACDVIPLQGDVRELTLGHNDFDIIVAASVLHHLRTDTEWATVFRKFYEALKPGGGFWVYDLVDHDIPAVQHLMQERYGEYLVSLKGPEYRKKVFDYVEKEDTPRSLIFQTELMTEVGFRNVSVLHKNGPFAAFGALK
jgi:tRNA (cmo5U34)-methyltransferase